ncbi:hypothetical protein [Kitasatospora sp. NPDC007106]|uniref:hypothetical protein n=1 Tax=Kitasatospora sp. NPDC007106 TaxID=3156914 RepID=UPI00341165AD
MENPRRNFVLTTSRENPYRDLVLELGSLVPLVDDTDVNCDASFNYILGANGSLFVRLSMVGPYAMLSRDQAEGRSRLIATEQDCDSAVEREVFRTMTRAGLHLLSEEQLTTEIDLALPEVQHASVYNALFAPEEETTTRWPE